MVYARCNYVLRVRVSCTSSPSSYTYILNMHSRSRGTCEFVRVVSFFANCISTVICMNSCKFAPHMRIHKCPLGPWSHWINKMTVPVIGFPVPVYLFRFMCRFCKSEYQMFCNSASNLMIAIVMSISSIKLT